MAANLDSLGLDDAARYLGMAPSTLRKRAAAGLIPGRKVGGRWQFSRFEIAKYFDSFRNDAPRLTPEVNLLTGAAKYIYVIACGELVKIGVARDVKERWRTLATANPLIGEVLYSTRALTGATSIEREIHNDLRQFHARGEWFKCSHQVAIDAVRAREVANP